MCYYATTVSFCFTIYHKRNWECNCAQTATQLSRPKQRLFRNKFQCPYSTCANLILWHTCLFRTTYFPPLRRTAWGMHWNTYPRHFFSQRQHMSTSAHRRWKVEGTDWVQNWTSLLLRMTPAQIKARPLAMVDTTTARIKDVDISPWGASPWGPAAGTESISRGGKVLVSVFSRNGNRNDNNK